MICGPRTQSSLLMRAKLFTVGSTNLQSVFGAAVPTEPIFILAGSEGLLCVTDWFRSCHNPAEFHIRGGPCTHATDQGQAVPRPKRSLSNSKDQSRQSRVSGQLQNYGRHDMRKVTRYLNQTQELFEVESRHNHDRCPQVQTHVQHYHQTVDVKERQHTSRMSSRSK